MIKISNLKDNFKSAETQKPAVTPAKNSIAIETSHEIVNWWSDVAPYYAPCAT